MSSKENLKMKMDGRRACWISGFFFWFLVGFSPALAPGYLFASEEKTKGAESGDDEIQAESQAVRALQQEAMLQSLRSEGLEVHGMVLDAESGQPIPGVRMIVTKGILGADRARRIEKTRQTIDGPFHYRCEPCLDVQIRFLAEGYHGEMIRLGGFGQRLERAELAEKASPGATPSESPVQRHVLLQPVHDPVELQSFSAHLQVDADPAKTRVLTLEKGEVRERSLRRAREIATKSAAPLRSVRLLAATDAAGQPQFDLGKSSAHTKLARRAAIDFSQADGGAILYESAGKSPTQLRREMTQAPDTGYQPILELDPEAKEPIYFYVRVGDLYGRGVAYPPVLKEITGGHRQFAAIRLDLNPDGSRRLVTVE